MGREGNGRKMEGTGKGREAKGKGKGNMGEPRGNFAKYSKSPSLSKQNIKIIKSAGGGKQPPKFQEGLNFLNFFNFFNFEKVEADYVAKPYLEGNGGSLYFSTRELLTPLEKVERVGPRTRLCGAPSPALAFVEPRAVGQVGRRRSGRAGARRRGCGGAATGRRWRGERCWWGGGLTQR